MKTIMKYHLTLNGKTAACGIVDARPDTFLYPIAQFKGHFSKEDACKKCTQIANIPCHRGPWLVLHKTQELTRHVSFTDEPEKHARISRETTAGHIEFVYVPHAVAMAANEMLDALKRCLAENGLSLDSDLYKEVWRIVDTHCIDDTPQYNGCHSDEGRIFRAMEGGAAD
jgi:hypothetical protein